MIALTGRHYSGSPGILSVRHSLPITAGQGREDPLRAPPGTVPPQCSPVSFPVRPSSFIAACAEGRAITR